MELELSINDCLPSLSGLRGRRNKWDIIACKHESAVSLSSVQSRVSKKFTACSTLLIDRYLATTISGVNLQQQSFTTTKGPLKKKKKDRAIFKILHKHKKYYFIILSNSLII